MNDKISVIIPCYNQAQYLKEAVTSVLAQSFNNWECLIINDGSRDATEKVALELCNTDKRIKYIRKENGGLSSARNSGLKEASGEYIQFLDADDKIDPRKFSTSLKVAGTADVIISSFTMFTSDTNACAYPNFTLDKNKFTFQSILNGWDEEFVIPIHCGLFRASLFHSIRFNESLKAREDWLMWLQIYQLNVETVFIDQPLAFYRSSRNSMSQNRDLMSDSLVAVYRIIYPLIAIEFREAFFNKAINSLEQRLAQASDLLFNTRRSKSYRVGNFFVKNFNKINPLK